MTDVETRSKVERDLDKARAAHDRRPDDGFAQRALDLAEQRYVRVLSEQPFRHVGGGAREGGGWR